VTVRASTAGWMRWLRPGVVALAVLGLAWGSWRDPQFWRTAQQRGDRLLAQQQYREAAQAYRDPWHIAVAQYRNGDFKEAAATFARVPGADGAFDQGNALLMHGAYDDAIASYDRALGFRPGWREAQENRALALARKQQIEDAGEDREQESADAYQPDDTVVDKGGQDDKSKPRDMNSQQLSDAELRASWLRRVQTTPGDFLRAKFAWQAAQGTPPPAGGGEGQP